MSKTNFETKRKDFEEAYLELNPEAKIEFTDKGLYADSIMAMHWAAYKRAYQQYASSHLNKRKQTIQINETPENQSFLMKNFIIGSSTSGEYLKMSVKPRLHQNFDIAKAEAERLNAEHPTRSFFVFGCVHKVRGTLEKLKDNVVVDNETNKLSGDIPAGTFCLFQLPDKPSIKVVVASQTPMISPLVKVWLPEEDKLHIVSRRFLTQTESDPEIVKQFKIYKAGIVLYYQPIHTTLEEFGSIEFVVSNDVISRNDKVKGIFKDTTTKVVVSMSCFRESPLIIKKGTVGYYVVDVIANEISVISCIVEEDTKNTSEYIKISFDGFSNVSTINMKDFHLIPPVTDKILNSTTID